ncbi:MAG: hypothetical protein HWD61_07120 [Parachlamydiaceae bacterium]|nr:MAG: hypothetical protein HWD61_07120 [Parachlamydiaceae bacterium]
MRIWNIETGESKEILEGHKDGVTSLAVQDRILFSGSWDQSVRFWDLTKNESFYALSFEKMFLV